MNIDHNAIIEYVRSQGAGADITPDTKLFSSGLLDSFLMIELILFLEQSAGVKIPPDAITLDNLDTVDSMVNYIQGQNA